MVYCVKLKKKQTNKQKCHSQTFWPVKKFCCRPTRSIIIHYCSQLFQERQGCYYCRHFLHGLKMCKLLGYKLQIIFLSIFSHYELSHFLVLGYSYVEWMPCVYNSSYSFFFLFCSLLYVLWAFCIPNSQFSNADIFHMVWRCAWTLDIIIRLIFVTFFFTLWTLHHSILLFITFDLICNISLYKMDFGPFGATLSPPLALPQGVASKFQMYSSSPHP